MIMMKLNCSIAGQIKGLLEVLNTIKKIVDFCKCTRLNLCLSRIKTLQNWFLIASQEKCMQNGGHIYLSPKMLLWFCTVPSGAGLTPNFDTGLGSWKRDLWPDYHMRNSSTRSWVSTLTTWRTRLVVLNWKNLVGTSLFCSPCQYRVWVAFI